MKQKNKLIIKSPLLFSGSKYSYIKFLRKYLSPLREINDKNVETPKEIIDVFTGGGSIYLNFDDVTIINDLDKATYYFHYNVKYHFDKINVCYEKVKNDILKIRGSKDELNKYFRHQINNTQIEEPLFIILNMFCKKVSFSGLIKYNRKTGEYGINCIEPHGYKHRKFLSDSIITDIKKQLENQHKRLQNIQIFNLDYSELLNKLHTTGEINPEKNLIYLDPPYYNTFNNYAPEQSDNFEKELKEIMDTYTKLGYKIVMSNSNHDYIKLLFKDYNQEIIYRINKMKQGIRNTGKELIITN